MGHTSRTVQDVTARPRKPVSEVYSGPLGEAGGFQAYYAYEGILVPKTAPAALGPDGVPNPSLRQPHIAASGSPTNRGS